MQAEDGLTDGARTHVFVEGVQQACTHLLLQAIHIQLRLL